MDLSTINEDDEFLVEPSPIKERMSLIPGEGRGRRESTLLKPIGAFEPRVSNVTREKVRRQSEIIQQKIMEINVKSRKNIRKHLNDLEERQNKIREDQLKFWIKKTSDSPFLKDYFLIDQANALRRDNFQKEKQRRIEKIQLLKGMTGLPKDDVCPKERIPKLQGKISQEGLLALTHRAMKLNSIKVLEEKQVLDNIVNSSLKFPLLYEVTGSQSIHAGSQELLPSQIIQRNNQMNKKFT